MSLQNIRKPRESLVDAHNVWCAWCLDYPRPDDPITEHPLIEDWLIYTELISKKIPPSVRDVVLTFPVLGTVPWHKSCYNSFEAGSLQLSILNELRKYLQLDKYTDRYTPSDLDRLDRDALKLHEQGIYGFSSLLKKVRRFELERLGLRDDSSTTLEYEVASMAGVRPSKPRRVRQYIEEVILKSNDGNITNRPGLILNSANLASNPGDREYGDMLVTHYEEMPVRLKKKKKEELEVSYRLRKAQIRRSHVDAMEIIKSSRTSPYRIHTAQVLAGFIGLEQRRPGAVGFFKELAAEHDRLSWLYIAESSLGIAIADLKAGNIGIAYQGLIAAQYIYVLLGLQGTPHPNLPLLEVKDLDDCMPSDILMRNPQFKRLPQEKCLELRLGIFDDEELQQKLFRDLTGRDLGGLQIHKSNSCIKMPKFGLNRKVAEERIISTTNIIQHIEFSNVEHKINIKEVCMGDKFENVSQSIIATRGSIAKGIIEVRNQHGNEIAGALRYIETALTSEAAEQLTEEQRKEALELLAGITQEGGKPDVSKPVLRSLGKTLWSLIEKVKPLSEACLAAWNVIEKIWT